MQARNQDITLRGGGGGGGVREQPYKFKHLACVLIVQKEMLQ